MSNPNPPALVGRAPRWFVLLFLLALAAYGIFLAAHATTVAGGSDSSGYLNSARLLASGHLRGELRVPSEFGPLSALDRAHFTPFGFFAFLPGSALPPTYPTGLPLHLAAASRLLGWHYGPLAVELFGALAALGLLYLIARELRLGPALAAAGAVALGACPIFIFTSIQPLSDTLATTWTLAAVYPALCARRHAAWAAVCGAAFAVAVLVRPTNAVLLPSLLVLLGLKSRRLGLFVAGGLPGAIWFGTYNQLLYGGPLRSGYGDIFAAFGLSHVPASLVDFARWLTLLLPAALLVLPIAAPFDREFRDRTFAALAVWFGAVIAFFSTFDSSHEAWWSLRYILPALPPLILAALLGLAAAIRRFPAPQRPALLAAAALFLTLWSVAGSVYWTRKLGALYTQGYEQAYADAGRAARQLLPPDSLVLAFHTCGALYFYTDFPVLRWDQIDAAHFARYSALAAKSGRPICAVLFDSEENAALRERCPGEWTRLGSVKNITLWRLAAAAPAPAAK